MREIEEKREEMREKEGEGEEGIKSEEGRSGKG